MDEARRGAAALDEKRFTDAVAHYSEAIKQKPQAVDYYIKRSTAYTRLSPPNYDLAVKDAETAVVLATKRAKRELIAQAQMRRGIALFGLERWTEAKQCFDWVKKLDQKEKTVAIWDMKVDKKIESSPDADTAMKIKEIPDITLPEPGTSSISKQQAPADEKPQPATSTSTIHIPTSTTQTPANKIRHEWYQQDEYVIVTLFAKGIPKDKVSVDIKSRSLELSFPLMNGATYEFSLDPFFADIDATASTHKIMSTKAEITLRKTKAGLKWPSLEATDPVHDVEISTDETKESAAIRRAAISNDSGPAYPTSSKSGPKNWDKLANDLTKKKPKSESGATVKDDVDEGYADDEEGDPVNGFFKTLYKGADDDTRRAMMKSYQESNGTALSTNWSEVGKGKVETTPPDGMEAKKW